MVMDDLLLPTRNILALVSHNDQRQIRWFEQVTSTVNSQIGTASIRICDGNAIETGDPVHIVDLEA